MDIELECEKIETLDDLNECYPSWRQLPTDAIKLILRLAIENKSNITDIIYNGIVKYIIDEVQFVEPIYYNNIVFDFVDNKIILQWALENSKKYGQELDLNGLAIIAVEENNLNLLKDLIKAGANNFEQLLESAYNYENYNFDLIKMFFVYMKEIGKISQAYDFVSDIILSSSDPTSNKTKEFESWLVEQMYYQHLPVDYNILALMSSDLNRVDILQSAIQHGAKNAGNIALIAAKNNSLPVLQLALELEKIYHSVIYEEVIDFALLNNNTEIAKFLIDYMIANEIEIELEPIINSAIMGNMDNMGKNLDMVKWIINKATILNYQIDFITIVSAASRYGKINILEYIIDLARENLSRADFKTLLKKARQAGKENILSKQYLDDLIKNLI